MEQSVSSRVNEMYRDFFYGKLSVEDFVTQTLVFKNSANPEENELMILIVKTVLDEFGRMNVFSKHDTAVQFGKLCGEMVRQRVVRNCALIHLLRTIYWASCEPPQSNFFCCGSTALAQFQERLHEWPSYCYLLKSKKNISTFDKNLYATIVDCANSKLPTVISLIHKLFNSIDFQMNLDVANISTIKELSRFIGENREKSPNELAKGAEDIFKRYLTQQNHKKKLFEIALFTAAIMDEGIQPRCIKVSLTMLGSVVAISFFTGEAIKIMKKLKVFDQQESYLFLSLGNFLGLLTLGLNKPIRSNQVQLRAILRDDTTPENIDVIVRFLAKVLKGGVESEVYNANNPFMVPLLQKICEFSLSEQFASLNSEEVRNVILMFKITPAEYLSHHLLNRENEEISRSLILIAKERSRCDGGVFAEFTQSKTVVPLSRLKQLLLSEKSLCFDSLSRGVDDPIPEILICDSFKEEHWKMMIDIFLDFSMQDISKAVSISLSLIMKIVGEIIQKDFCTETDITKIEEATGRVLTIAQKPLWSTCKNCVEAKLWKYISQFVFCSAKQQELNVVMDVIRETVMKGLNKYVDNAISIKMNEVKKVAKRYVSQFVMKMEESRRSVAGQDASDFIAEGYEYLEEGPDLPAEIKIAKGGVTQQQMEVYAGGVENNTYM
ncbi:hypothetical protein EIN_250300 [Entamoeba invadens IP1]|uniref:Uncharacterized protein n=1 Tax=Entamoeba invadens IP1 TaxID=370355 RepID=A0A0A1UEB6_ENTIV|nr:hypothetical protein EIN_250300 [Entamoeba invadens IP1]ELP94936.1 hypothetical protein EIN_250300 [Entamoeba invadens IP1]|eukprot:XP_004261707.1 hypothetical protein EIN_250300 [Entamoeba invadens IP1]